MNSHSWRRAIGDSPDINRDPSDCYRRVACIPFGVSAAFDGQFQPKSPARVVEQSSVLVGETLIIVASVAQFPCVAMGPDGYLAAGISTRSPG